ncbi:MAG: glycosyltransferase [Candidatus Lokiarchaeia archaeon]
MNILVLQETDWITRGPHVQHHVFERLSKNPSINITVIDYDINKLIRKNSKFLLKQKFVNIQRAVKNSKVEIIRTAYLQIPYLSRITSLISNFFEMLKIFRKSRPDIIVSFSMTNGLIGLILGKIFRIPFIFYYIDLLHKLVPISYLQGIARIVTRFSLKLADQVIIQTNYHHKLVINEGTSLKRVIKIPEGVDLENTKVDEKKLQFLKTKFSILENDFVIFFMGFLYDFAGLEEIITFYDDDVKAGKYNLKFVILGDGGIYDQLKVLVKEIEANWVILAGRVPFFEISEYIQLADLCLLSFKRNEITKEIIPIKILEYMAMQKPVLCNSLPAIINEFGRNSGIIFAKNQHTLIKEIGNLINKEEKLKKIGLDGFKFVSKNNLWTNIMIEIKNTIINLIKKKNYSN